jgi:hypothetical protein
MKKNYNFLLLALSIVGVTSFTKAQLAIDTLAIQDFELTPSTPTWNFTGPVVYSSGTSSATAAPPNSPIGINSSRAWETTSVSGGLVLDFDNVTVPSGYDSVRVNFKLAAMNLNGSTGGPDHLDYVLVEYSIDGGNTFVSRLRIRGAAANNSFWGYDATGVAKVNYLPATETMFQPANSGLQTTEGYSTCEIAFPGSITQVQIRITGRSSSSTDTWLVDNLVLTGENSCSPVSSSVNENVCFGSDFTYADGTVSTNITVNENHVSTLTGAAANGCDSIVTQNLNVITVDVSVTQNGNDITANVTGATFQWLDCGNSNNIINGETSATYTATVSGDYAVEVTQNGCVDTSACTNVNVVGIAENSFQLISLFPNPTNENITINAQKSLINSIEIYNELGQLALVKQSVNSSTTNIMMPKKNGIYFVKIILEHNILVQRVIKF